MPTPSPEGVSKILTERPGGDRDALDKVMPLVYDELRNLAHRYMLQERGGHTLQTTALVNEVYLKFANRDGLRAQNRAHFLALAARQMRCVLVDYARGHARDKRGGDAEKVPLDEAVIVSNDRTAEMLALDEALNGLAKFDERKSRVAELRFFAGLTVEETAEALSISPETVNRDWRLAKAWLRKELSATVTPERWREIEQLFHAALERAPHERGTFLANACSDPAMRTEVEALLQSDRAQDDSVETLPGNVAASWLTQDQTEKLIGQTIGRYKILRSVGAGGMGQVYLAEDPTLGRKVALKLLPAQLMQDQNRLRRLEQEARNASALNHPNIITIHEIGQWNDTHFIVTEFIEGKTLRERMQTEPIPTPDVVEIGIQVAGALAAAHAAGIIHRDIKPANIMVRDDGYVKVLDFGLAKLTAATSVHLDRTDPGHVMGTVGYMSPEQALGKSLDHRTDIFSLGVVLYEMATGTRPFDGDSDAAAYDAILHKAPPRSQKLSNELDGVIRHALEKETTARYQTASELHAELKRIEARTKPATRPVN